MVLLQHQLLLLGLVLEQVTGKPIGDLYREQIFEPLGLKDTSFPEPSDSSILEPHAQGYTLQRRFSGEKPIDSTDWSPSEAWTAGQMISTVDDLLLYGRALGIGKGLLSPISSPSVSARLLAMCRRSTSLR